MTQDKKKGVPTPKVKNLTKSQKKLLNKSQREIEVLTREIFQYVAERINRLGVQVVEKMLEDFLVELGLEEEDWQFQPEKNQFIKRDN